MSTISTPVVGALAEVTVSLIIHTSDGFNDAQIIHHMTNSTSYPRDGGRIVTTAIATAQGAGLQQDNRYLMLIPQSSGGSNFRVAGTTTEAGLTASSVCPWFIPVKGTSSDFRLFTTVGTAFRVRLFDV